RFLLAFEQAERAACANDVPDTAAWLTFVIVGAGPTGVELAGMLPTVARFALPPDFRRIDASKARVILVEGGPRVLPAFPAELSEHAAQDLRDLGVEVLVNARVTSIADGFVEIGTERIEARTVFWAAGNTASPLGASLGVPL